MSRRRDTKASLARRCRAAEERRVGLEAQYRVAESVITALRDHTGWLADLMRMAAEALKSDRPEMARVIGDEARKAAKVAGSGDVREDFDLRKRAETIDEVPF